MEDYVRERERAHEALAGGERAALRHPERAGQFRPVGEPGEPGQCPPLRLGHALGPAPGTSTCPTSSRTRTATTWSRLWSFAVTPSRRWPTQLPGALAPGGGRQQHRSDRGDDAGLPRERRAARRTASNRSARSALQTGGCERGDRRKRRCPSSRTSNGSTPSFVADQIDRHLSGTGGGASHAGPACTATGSARVSLGGVALTPGASATVPLTVGHRLRHPGGEPGRERRDRRGRPGDASARAVTRSRPEETIPEIAVGEAQERDDPARQAAPTGQNVPITVRAKPVPGEEVTDNNVGEFTVIFTRLSAARVPWRAVDDLSIHPGHRCPRGRAALRRVALLWVIVLAVKLRRLRSAQRSHPRRGGETTSSRTRPRSRRPSSSCATGWRRWPPRLEGGVAATERADGRRVAHTSLVRYDAMNELSGQQSSTVALLDARRTGVVISSILHRDQARLYVKQVRDGSPSTSSRRRSSRRSASDGRHAPRTRA